MQIYLDTFLICLTSWIVRNNVPWALPLRTLESNLHNLLFEVGIDSKGTCPLDFPNSPKFSCKLQP